MAHRRWLPAAVVCLAGLMASCTAAPSPGPTADGFRTLAVEDYRAKMTAGWLGQMAREEIGRGVEFHDGLRLLDYHLSVCGEAAHLALLSPQQPLPLQEPTT